MDIIRWDAPNPPEEQDLHLRMQQQGLVSYKWSNGPGDRYAAHTHSYEKVLYCVRGTICFIIHSNSYKLEYERGEYLDLNPGDCLILPAGVSHSAQVGSLGVTCIEGARYPTM